MPMMPLLTAALEGALNRVLWRDRGLKAARQRLKGKVLAIHLKELSQPLVLNFSDSQIDVLSQWPEAADCMVTLSASVLMELRNRQNLPALIKAGRLEVTGDIQVLQQFSALIDLAEFDPAEFLSPWLGDIAAQSLMHTGKRVLSFLHGEGQRRQRQASTLLTEELRATPSALELAWFCEESEALAAQVTEFEKKLSQWEQK